MKPLYETQQIRELEKLAMQQGMSDYGLMQAAGLAVFSEFKKHFPDARRLVVLCGSGNNGGDGFEFARLAHEANFEVIVYTVSSSQAASGPAKQAFEACRASGVTIQKASASLDLNCDLIIDALLGIGLNDTVREPYAEVIAQMNAALAPVLSIDLPSGLSADTGRAQGIAVEAALTVSLVALKQGLFTSQGPSLSGKVVCCELGIPESVFQRVQPTVSLLNWNRVRPLLPIRSRDAHKGDYGHVLVIGGDYGMGGAVRMAAEAAMRVGSGLVTVATRPEHLSVVSGSRPELMCHQVNSVEELEPLLARASVILIGPGLGKSEWSKMLFERVLQSDLPKVLDADALNLLADSPVSSTNWVLTPHPGEAGRLLEQACQQLQNNRFAAIKALQVKYGGAAVLKGVGTLIKGDLENISLCPAGNPGMATGGMGDVLSGVIAGLIAQKLSLVAAAEAGVFIHSLAADRAAEEGGERGLLASDLLLHIRKLVNPMQVGDDGD